MASGVTLDLSRPSDDFRKKERLMIKTVSTDIHFHSPRPRAMVLGSAIAFMFIAPAAVGDVISFNGSGSVGIVGTLYDPNDNSNTAPFDTRLTPSWNGAGPFDQSNQQQVTLSGETLTATTRLQLDAATTNGITTLEYRETESMSYSGVDPNQAIGFNYDKAVWINFTTTGWTELDFTNLSGGLTYDLSNASLYDNSGGGLYDIDYSSGSGVVFWAAPIPASYSGLSLWAGSSHTLLLGAGSWTIELNDQFNWHDSFNDTMNFDMEFSNFVIPGPGGIAAILGLAAVRRRRR
jgi:hypothetical protein